MLNAKHIFAFLSLLKMIFKNLESFPLYANLNPHTLRSLLAMFGQVWSSLAWCFL